MNGNQVRLFSGGAYRPGFHSGRRAGQEDKVKSETKLEVKDGKDVTLTGCVERLPIRMGRHSTS